ncbi:MAG: homoserine kinase [Mycobacterium sp.]|nr:homoserine kinase [Mycobacterium sp.]
MIVRVPASSANLGPGFDTLGMALSLHVEAGVIEGEVPARAQRIDQFHPAGIAFRRAGGEGDLWVCSPIPVGRGLGFSGSVRIAGIVAAHAQRYGSDPDLMADRAPTMLALAAELEGHADNAAASLFGGIVATADGRAVRIPLAFDPAVVVWIPSFTTSTDESRTKMGRDVPLGDAVFNIGRTALLVAALAAGDTSALRSATQDRLHQDRRLASAEPSKLAMRLALEAGAWCCWLSGSGPTVAAMCPYDDADELAARMPADGHTKVLRIDHEGAVIESDD